MVYPDPGFPTYRAMIEVAGGIPAPAPLRPDGASFDMAALADLVRSRAPAHRAELPANPTGGVMPREDVEAVARLAEEHGAWILSR